MVRDLYREAKRDGAQGAGTVQGEGEGLEHGAGRGRGGRGDTAGGTVGERKKNKSAKTSVESARRARPVPSYPPSFRCANFVLSCYNSSPPCIDTRLFRLFLSLAFVHSPLPSPASSNSHSVTA